MTARPNLLKHGPYNEHVSPDEQAGLRKMRVDAIEQEITVLRLFIKRLMKLGENLEDVDVVTKIAHCVTSLVNSLNGALRTHSQLTSGYSELDEALFGVLRDEPFFTPGPILEPQGPPPQEPLGPEAEKWFKTFEVDVRASQGRRRKLNQAR